METKSFVELPNEVRGNVPNSRTHSLNGNRANLLGLGFGVCPQSGCFGGELDLEGVDPTNTRSNRNHGHYAPTEASGGRVSFVVADDNRRPAFVRLSPDDGVEVHKSNLATKHHV